MIERPILFRPELVRAILEGRKSVTRRIVKPQPDFIGRGILSHVCFQGEGNGKKERTISCPYGVPGDRLWVRETWCAGRSALRMESGKEYGIFPERHPKPGAKVVYRATSNYGEDPPPWRPSIHMPRWASRLTLEVVSVRVERLQEITTEDIIDEGFSTKLREYDAECHLQDQFRKTWDSINRKRAQWASNPWVWRIEFRRVNQ